MMECLSQRFVTTRKPHRCWGCMQEFPVGSRMEAVVSVDDCISRVYWCQQCHDYVQALEYWQCEDGFSFGEIGKVMARRKHWYRITIDECVLCGRSHKDKERMYTPKPEDPHKRRVINQSACNTHF